MAEFDIPAVFAAVSLEPGALDVLAKRAAEGRLRLTMQVPGRLSTNVVLDARAGEGEGLDANSVPALMLDLARLGLAAAHAAYTTPGAPIGGLVSEEVRRLRRVGLALRSDPGAQASLSNPGD